MNRKTLYWVAGIAAAVIILLIFWSSLSSRSASQNKENNSGGNEASGTSDNSDLESYIKEQDRLMDKMMEDMENVSLSGSADLDFVNGMLPHHEAAVSMSESYLANGGSDEELRKLAEDIIKAQKQEIEQMQAMAERFQSQPSQSYGLEQSYLEDYDKMLSGHHSDHSSTSHPANIDAAFAEGMIMHHQMAVDMAQSILEYTHDEEVTELAQKIVRTQQEEITKMQKIHERVSK